MNEPARQAISVTREELYEQVWTTPMRKLALRYGLSDRQKWDYIPTGRLVLSSSYYDSAYCQDTEKGRRIENAINGLLVRWVEEAGRLRIDYRGHEKLLFDIRHLITSALVPCNPLLEEIEVEPIAAPARGFLDDTDEDDDQEAMS